MKKILLCAALLAATVIASATDVWEGEHAVDWSSTLKIDADKFTDMKLGDKLVIEFKDAAGEVIELHSDGGMLPGTRFAHSIFPDQSSAEVFATPAMLASLQTHGLEVCGMDFIATKIWYGDGKESIDANTVWSGFFWMDQWSTLEITKNSFAGVDWSKFTAIRFYSEAGRTDYVINVMTTWSNKLGDQTTMTMTNDYAELSLSGIDMAAALEGTDRLMIQCNKEGGNPFNFTQIELVPDPMAVQAVPASAQSADASQKFDLQGRPVAQPAKGTVYILNGKKYLEK
jgi:hypothetical protein